MSRARHGLLAALVLVACSGDPESSGGAAGAGGTTWGAGGGGSAGTAGGAGSGQAGQGGSAGGGGSAGAAGGTSGSGGAPDGPRNVYHTVDLETGQLQPSSSLHDSLRMQTMVESGELTNVTAISKANPAVVTAPGHGYANGTGITLRNVGGMTELRDRLFRAKNVSQNTFELWEDHAPGDANDDQVLGKYPVDTTGLPAYTSGAQAERWESAAVTNGGAGPGENRDGTVVESATVGGEVVLPRRGEHFMRTAIFFDKDYSVFPGNSGKNKPRINFHTPEELQGDYDKETWVAFSVFLPSSFEHETANKGAAGSNQIWRVTADSGPSGGDTAYINLFVPNGGSASGGSAVPADDVTHWVVRFNVDGTSTNGGGPNGKTEWFDLGSVVPDLGKWTDFVIRYRLNPFTKSTNAKSVDPDGKDQVYPGNEGIFQVWKSEGEVGENGDRQMVLLIDKVGEPVGYVPHATNRISHHFRQYKYGWHHNPTAVAGPVFIAFDEFRYGETERDGTGFSDVHPSRMPMP